MSQQNNQTLSLVLSGAAGQGIATVSDIVSIVLKRSGYHVFTTEEYMSRVRGGVNSTEIRISATVRVCAVVDKIDILVPLIKEALDHLDSRITDDTILLGDSSIFGDHACCEDKTIIDFSFIEIAKDVGDTIYANTVAAGVICGLLQADKKILNEYLVERFQKKTQAIQDNNLEAAQRGYAFGNMLLENGKFKFKFTPDASVKEELLLNGTKAIAMGALAGGCNYVCFYPMSPATGVPTFLAQHSTDFPIIVDQTEDEISGINKVIGAWYAGARGMVSTSGGGFALMNEGLSLAGAIESPLVIHLAQRPGPATGLPTRTQQGDLNFALHGGHGDFPRIILAPSTLQDAFFLTYHAFNLADKYQVPVFILTDQYFVVSSYNIPSKSFDELDDLTVEHAFVETETDYKRYEFTDTGISPRGIPNHGQGHIRVDSHTHTEDGYITEDQQLRVRMVDKAHRKLEEIKQDYQTPLLVGPRNFKTLIISWGSTFHIIKEAINAFEDVAMLHFTQLYPLQISTFIDYLKQANNLIFIENHSTAQFARLLKLEVPVQLNIEKQILKYTGYPFTVEEVRDNIVRLIKNEDVSTGSER